MMDYAPHFPEAIALPSFKTERVAEALVEMFSRVGVPDKMLRDCRSQFTSDIMKGGSKTAVIAAGDYVSISCSM